MVEKKGLIEYWIKKRDRASSFLRSNEEFRERRKCRLEKELKMINSTITKLKNEAKK